jgi:hypothetical protein
MKKSEADFNILEMPIALSERTLIVCPIPREYSTHRHISDFRGLYPLDYAYMSRGMKPDREVKPEEEENIIHEVGSYLLTDFGKQKICWICIHNVDHAKYRMSAIEDIIKAMAGDELHKEFDMAFPMLGWYEVDGVDAYDVELLIRHFFCDTPNIVDIHHKY